MTCTGRSDRTASRRTRIADGYQAGVERAAVGKPSGSAHVKVPGHTRSERRRANVLRHVQGAEYELMTDPLSEGCSPDRRPAHCSLADVTRHRYPLHAPASRLSTRKITHRRPTPPRSPQGRAPHSRSAPVPSRGQHLSRPGHSSTCPSKATPVTQHRFALRQDAMRRHRLVRGSPRRRRGSHRPFDGTAWPVAPTPAVTNPPGPSPSPGSSPPGCGRPRPGRTV